MWPIYTSSCIKLTTNSSYEEEEAVNHPRSKMLICGRDVGSGRAAYSARLELSSQHVTSARVVAQGWACCDEQTLPAQLTGLWFALKRDMIVGMANQGLRFKKMRKIKQ